MNLAQDRELFWALSDLEFFFCRIQLWIQFRHLMFKTARHPDRCKRGMRTVWSEMFLMFCIWPNSSWAREPLLAVVLDGDTEAGPAVSLCYTWAREPCLQPSWRESLNLGRDCPSLSLWSSRRETLKLNRGYPSFVPEPESIRLLSSRRETQKVGQGCPCAIPEPESLRLRSSRRETLKLGLELSLCYTWPESLRLRSSRRETLKLGQGCPN